MLHNIDPYGDFAGIRVGDYKLLIGNVGVGWDGWYPPYQLQGDETKLHYLNFTDNFSESAHIKLQREKLNENYQKYWGTEILERIKELETERKQKGKLVFQSEKTDASGKTLVYEKGTPVRVECGEKPANASTNCDPRKYPCLFHIPSDPCEYTNLANQHTDVVSLPKSFSNLFHLFSQGLFKYNLTPKGGGCVCLNSLKTFVATVATHQILRLTTVATVEISISHVNNGETGASYAISVTTFESIVIVDDIMKI